VADAQGSEAGRGANERWAASPQLDDEWQRRFEQDVEPEPAAFDPEPDWRGRAMTWDRKLAGADILRRLQP